MKKKNNAPSKRSRRGRSRASSRGGKKAKPSKLSKRGGRVSKAGKRSASRVGKLKAGSKAGKAKASKTGAANQKGGPRSRTSRSNMAIIGIGGAAVAIAVIVGVVYFMNSGDEQSVDGNDGGAARARVDDQGEAEPKSGGSKGLHKGRSFVKTPQPYFTPSQAPISSSTSISSPSYKCGVIKPPGSHNTKPTTTKDHTGSVSHSDSHTIQSTSLTRTTNVRPATLMSHPPSTEHASTFTGHLSTTEHASSAQTTGTGSISISATFPTMSEHGSTFNPVSDPGPPRVTLGLFRRGHHKGELHDIGFMSPEKRLKRVRARVRKGKRGRMVGGQVKKIEESPWTVIVHHQTIGTGVILNDHWVLTVAHTLQPENGGPFRKGKAAYQDPTEYSLKHATWIRYGSHEYNQTKFVPLKRCIVHPEYEKCKGCWEKDVALCETERPIQLDGETAAPICLPGPGRGGPTDEISIDEKARKGDQCEFVAWGYTGDPKHGKGSKLSMEMKGKSTKIIDIGPGYIMFDKSTCSGDAGGPLTCPKKDKNKETRHVVYGLNTYRYGCDVDESGATNIESKADWIKDTLIKAAEVTTTAPTSSESDSHLGSRNETHQLQRDLGEAIDPRFGLVTVFDVAKEKRRIKR